MLKDHAYYMKLALDLALKAKGKTSPNPMVGAVVVKGDKVIGRGYHEKAGLSHAESVALDEAGPQAKGATLYVTLEPCAHYGRTPPCVDGIIRSGIKQVVIAMIDPNPRVNGKGIAILKEHNIKVEQGIMEEEARRINEVFIKSITSKLPFVTVKVAESLDGKIAARGGDSKWITCDKSRAYAHKIRQDYDAIMVGVNTILRDDPKLDTWFSKRHPVKVVVDSQLSTPPDANIFADNAKVVIITLPAKPGQETENRKRLAEKARILEVKEKSGQINLKDMMKKLALLNITHILVEGGGTLIGSLFDDDLVDKVMFFISPKIIGGKEAPSSVMGEGVARIDKAIRIKNVKLRHIAEDILIEGYIK